MFSVLHIIEEIGMGQNIVLGYVINEMVLAMYSQIF